MYPEGPRRQMTDPWKQRVKDALAANKRSGTYPRNQSDLVKAIGELRGTLPPDRTAITKMWKAESSALVDDICAVLKIDPPLVEAQPGTETVDMVRRLPESDQRDVADFVRKYILTRKKT